MNDLENNQIVALSNWMTRLGYENDSFIKFITLWFVFNSWLIKISSIEFDRPALKWFYANDSNLKSWALLLVKKPEIQEVLKELAKLSPVPKHRDGDKIELTDTGNLQQVMDFIYQIRCNLFHGYKNPNDETDKLLVEFSSQFLLPWLKGALEDEKNTCS